jgi:transposase-like protein
MRKREKLTPEERFALALDLIRSEHSFADVCSHYNVSHTTAYKIRNAFLDGGRRALAGARAREAAETIADDTESENAVG